MKHFYCSCRVYMKAFCWFSHLDQNRQKCNPRLFRLPRLIHFAVFPNFHPPPSLPHLIKTPCLFGTEEWTNFIICCWCLFKFASSTFAKIITKWSLSSEKFLLISCSNCREIVIERFSNTCISYTVVEPLLRKFVFRAPLL